MLGLSLVACACAAAAPMRTVKMDQGPVHFSIEGGEPQAWRVDPTLSPDVLNVECAVDSRVEVVFSTDLETQSFVLGYPASLRFKIVDADGREALTELRCVLPPVRYRGSYAADRPEKGDFERDLTPVLETYFEPGAPGVSTVIWSAGERVYEKSIGLADLEARSVRSSDMPFDIASISKEFIAVAILCLVEDGRLSLSDPLGRYVEGLPYGGELTVEHLLSHTSGLPMKVEPDGIPPGDPFSLEPVLAMLRRASLAFPPGTQGAYSNADYLVLAHLIDVVTGEPHTTFLRDRLFTPAGMSATGFLADLGLAALPIRGYVESGGEYTPPYAYQVHPTRTYGSGNIISTFEDLRAWHAALLDGRILSQEFLQLAMSPYRLPDGTQIPRGFSFQIGAIDGEKVIFNSGDLLTHTRYLLAPERNLEIIVNMNLRKARDGELLSLVRNQLAGKMFDASRLAFYGRVVDLDVE